MPRCLHQWLWHGQTRHHLLFLTSERKGGRHPDQYTPPYRITGRTWSYRGAPIAVAKSALAQAMVRAIDDQMIFRHREVTRGTARSSWATPQHLSPRQAFPAQTSYPPWYTSGASLGSHSMKESAHWSSCDMTQHADLEAPCTPHSGLQCQSWVFSLGGSHLTPLTHNQLAWNKTTRPGSTHALTPF